MFRNFKNQTERRAFGGGAFVEIQYCKLDRGTKLKKIVSFQSIEHWNDSSLYIYVDDINEFVFCYKDIFDEVDVCGINYYSPEQLEEIIKKIESDKPSDYLTLLEWLKQGVDYNGFYILGI